MKIGILVSMINNFGEKGFYNSQEIGMAKALVSNGHRVIVYKLLKKGSVLPLNEARNNLDIKYFTVASLGINGLVQTKILDKTLDRLVFFSDTQLSVPAVYRWCKKNEVQFVPYIGVIESHSNNKIIKKTIDFLFKRNLAVFKKCRCLVKNSDVARRLNTLGINNTVVAPVGLDIDLLRNDYRLFKKDELKRKYGFEDANKVLLFIGRLEQEKRPVDLIEYFNKLRAFNDEYRLLIVGKGNLYADMMRKIDEYSLSRYVKYIEKIPNENIWELYRLCDYFVNLNKQEIFGMVLLEAMYYETTVIAWHAPGPDYIIEHNKSGFLVSSEDDILQIIMNSKVDMGPNAHERVIKHLTWNKTAQIITS